MAGWGIGSWGTSSWGIGLVGALFIESAVATGPRSVRVTLSQPPAQGSTIGGGDALNPNTWTLTDLNTGKNLTVISVVAGSLDVEFEIFVLEAFSSYPNSLRIGSEILVTGNGLLISAPKTFDFFGMGLSEQLEPTTALEDLENPPFPLDTHPAGTLNVDASGDYVRHSGIPFLRKLILRRLTTGPGGFFHLQDYGLGIRLKEPLTTQDLIKLKTAVERQILREPEFDVVRASLTLTTNGILTINLSAILSQTQQEVNIPIEVPTALVSL